MLRNVITLNIKIGDVVRCEQLSICFAQCNLLHSKNSKFRNKYEIREILFLTTNTKPTIIVNILIFLTCLSTLRTYIGS